MTRLATVDVLPERATVFRGSGVSGKEAHDMTCGKCGAIVAGGVSPEGLSRLIESGPTILECGARGARNVVPSALAGLDDARSTERSTRGTCVVTPRTSAHDRPKGLVGCTPFRLTHRA